MWTRRTILNVVALSSLGVVATGIVAWSQAGPVSAGAPELPTRLTEES